MNSLFVFWRNLLVLVAPYWQSEERWVSGALLGCALAITAGLVYLSVLINEWRKLFFDALQNMDHGEFVHQLLDTLRL